MSRSAALWAGLLGCLAAKIFAADTDAARWDLLADQQAWTTWSPRSEIEPQFAFHRGDGPKQELVLEIRGGGDPDACGGWRRRLPPLKKGRRYRLEAAFQEEGVAAPGHCIWALTILGDSEYEELEYTGVRDGWRRMALDITPDRDLDELSLGLFLAWSDEGLVRWSDVTLQETAVAPPPRMVRLAAISGRPTDPASVEECIDFYCRRLDIAGAQGADLVCLPEVINADVIRQTGVNPSETIPGPTTVRLAEKARQYNMYVAASLVEREGPRLYNTGVIIDRGGDILGKYRKTHLTIGEGLLSGKRPGDSYPVFDADFGRIGYMICYDNHYPEVARILAVKGAEAIVFSNMGDGREDGTLWESYMRTRALDNHVHIAAAVNGGRSCIVSPRGEILSMTDKTKGAVAIADCNLGQSVRNFSGRQIDKRYLRVRRAETFEPLTQHYWESLGY